jgi:ATP-dependent helicase/nuclease subunit A
VDSIEAPSPDGGEAAAEAGYTTGRVDLVFRDGEGVVVVDYKTDRVNPSEVPAVMETHRAQAETYERGVKYATGLGVADVVFVFPWGKVEGRLRGA